MKLVHFFVNIKLIHLSKNIIFNNIIVMKKNIAIICGGNSLEHHVSLMTAYDVVKYSNTLSDYNIIIIGIPKELNSKWKFEKGKNIDFFFKPVYNENKYKINMRCSDVYQIGNGTINNLAIYKGFLTTHGQNGEDGILQGFLEINNIPYLGCRVDQSAICMNKKYSKLIAHALSIPVVKYKSMYSSETITDYKDMKKLMIKINNGGSSIGCFIATKSNIKEQIQKAFKLDDEILLEDFLQVRELTIGILGKQDNLIQSLVGEFKIDNKVIDKSNSSLFNYDQKYNHDPNIDLIILPAKISNSIEKKIKDYSKTLYKTLNLTDYARIDFFLTRDNRVYFNEINTLPGFSSKSTFPLLFSKQFEYIELLNHLFK
jgi:D-alanine--D-alanine ligase